MPPDTKKTIARLYTLVAKLPLAAYLSSEKFSIFCREYDLTDTWKEHSESSKATAGFIWQRDDQTGIYPVFDHLIPDQTA